MDSIITQHYSYSQILLIFSDVKDYFILWKGELFFLNKQIYGKEFVFLKEKREGLNILCYPSGEKHIAANYKNGKHEGLAIIYYKSGKKEREINWKNDKREGPEVWYYESGKKRFEKQWRNGNSIRSCIFETGKKQ